MLMHSLLIRVFLRSQYENNAYHWPCMWPVGSVVCMATKQGVNALLIDCFRCGESLFGKFIISFNKPNVRGNAVRSMRTYTSVCAWWWKHVSQQIFLSSFFVTIFQLRHIKALRSQQSRTSQNMRNKKINQQMHSTYGCCVKLMRWYTFVLFIGNSMLIKRTLLFVV